MNERDNETLNEHIKETIYQWDGTAYGQSLKNMWENGTSYEGILEYMNEEIEDWEE